MPSGSLQFRLAMVSRLSLAIFAMVPMADVIAQTKFEVASVKQDKSVSGMDGDCRGIDSRFPRGVPTPPLGRCSITNAQFDHLVAIAYKLRKLEAVKGGPAWIHDDKIRFTIYAAAPHPESTTYVQLLEMLKDLLAERFKARIRVDLVQTDGYALVVSPGHPKLSPSKKDDALEVTGSGGWPSVSTMRQCTMEFLAGFLANRLDKPVVDQTGLKGAYDFTLAVENSDGASFAAAIRELGLRLERRKVPVPNVTIESAELPSAN
jgi:uncharacterized protein (TIGR03435 family)